MSGDLLALGAIAALAVAGGMRRGRGSRAVEYEVVVEPEQIPLPVDWRGEYAHQSRQAYTPGWTGPAYRWEGFSRGEGPDGKFRLIMWRLTIDAVGRWSALAFETAFRSTPAKGYLHLRNDEPLGSWHDGYASLVATITALVPGFNPPPTKVETADERDAKYQRMMAQRRRQERRGRRISGQGYYPDLLGPPADLRGWCVDRDDIDVEYDDGRIVHYSCDNAYRHHIQLRDGDDVVAGITLYAKKPWRGLQTATIATVYVDQGHRRQGLASELLAYAREHFRKVKHSRDLTDAGAAWKRAVR